MEHSWSRKKDVWSFRPDQGLIKRLDFFKLKDTFSVLEFLLDFLVLPVNKELIIDIGLLYEAC
jgi:hypothetical protein